MSRPLDVRATMVVRHLVAVLLLPMVVTVVVPWWLAGAALPLPAVMHLPVAVAAAATVVGVGLLLVGLGLFVWCVMLFAHVGQGTLAPWDPTRRLVVTGPYRHVRNPMISAVAIILLAEVLLLRSPRVLAWLALFLAINEVYFRVVEEPGLERRFGDAYRQYRRAVPRWVPRPAWRYRDAAGGSPDLRP